MDVSSPRNSPNSIYWLGIVLVILIMISSVFLAYKTKTSEVKQLKEEVAHTADIFVNPIINTVEGYILGLSRMGKRWEMGWTKNNWAADATLFYQDAQVFQSIEWVDPGLHIRQMVPIAEAQRLQGYDLSTLTTRTKVLELAKTKKQPILSEVINLIQGPKGILIVVPLFVANTFDGFIVGILNIEKFLQLKIFKDFESSYGIAIYQDNDPMFSTGSKVVNPDLTHEKTVQLQNIKWTFYLWPTEKLINARLTYLPLVILLGGSVFSFLLLWLLYLYHRNRIAVTKMLHAKKETLHLSERNKNILENINEGFISIDQNRRILDVNTYALEMFGYSKEEVLSKDVHDLLIPEKYRQAHKANMKQFLDTGKSDMFNREIDFLAMNKSGEVFPVEAVILPLKVNNQYEFHALLRDISTRKKAEADQARLATIVDTTNDAIISADLSGTIMTWNKGAEKMYGYRADEAIGQSIMILYPPDKKELFKPYLERLLRGEHIQDPDTERVSKSGRIIPVSALISPITNKKGKIVGASSITRDISESKKIETMKNEFISIVSHELRTPLTSIRGSISILASGKICELSDQANQLLEIANNNCERLIHLINDILDSEKIEAGQMEFRFKRLKLNKLINEALVDNQPIAAKHGLKLDFSTEENFYVYADHDRLMQVVTNLLSNAIRYSPINGVVKIRLTNLIDKVRVSVVDYGPGIPKEFRKKIFGKFSQADASATRKLSGTGLGLNISKAIIEKHKGTIGFLTTEGKGSTFYFDIPLSEEKDTTKQEIKYTPKNKILIYDPNQENAEQLQKILHRKHIASDIALSSDEAKHFLHKNTYAAVAIDVAVAHDESLNFIKDLRKNSATKDLPIIMVSAKNDDGKKELTGDILKVVDWTEKQPAPDRSAKIIDFINQKFRNKIPNILSVEDDQDMTRLISIMLENKASVWNATSVAKAKKLLSEHDFDLVILDLNLPDGYGTALLPCINYKTHKQIPVIVFSIDELDKKYSHLVHESLLKSIATNEQLYEAIESAIETGKTYE